MKIPQIPSVKIVASSTPAKKSLKALRFIPNFSIEPDWYDIKLGSDYIGTASFTTTKAVLATKSDLNRFPDAFISPTGNIKPYVSISYIEIFKDWRKSGLGRQAIQTIYKNFENSETCGRMALHAVGTATGFYSRLGFDIPEGLKNTLELLYNTCLNTARKENMSKLSFDRMLRTFECPTKTNDKFNCSGLRFFIPTKENLAMLFKKANISKKD